MAVRFSIGSQASNSISEAITVSNMNIQFEIRIFNLNFIFVVFYTKNIGRSKPIR